jgi:hypothetical protein
VLLVPTDVGENATFTVHEAEAASEAPAAQLPSASEKGAGTEIEAQLPKVTAAEPVFWSVKVVVVFVPSGTEWKS